MFSMISKKILVQVEGASCSGKSTFAREVKDILNSHRINSAIIEEAACKIFRQNKVLYKQFCSFSPNSKKWKQAKKTFQYEILSEQLSQLMTLPKEGSTVFLMDRGGASTAFHTLPLLSTLNKLNFEEECREITTAASIVFLLSPLGFLETDFHRYQVTYKEVLDESAGIKYFLDKWNIDYIEICTTLRNQRYNIAFNHIVSTLKKVANVALERDSF
jgi:hypothetical protein